ncbi:MAG: DUF4294 domain-containing protein [Bacteroidota bacterium]
MTKRFLIAFIFVLCSKFIFAQSELLGEDEKTAIKIISGIKAYATVVDGDTLPMVYLKTYVVASNLVFKNQKEKSAYTSLVRKVKKAYPYAKLASTKLKLYNKLLEGQPEAVKKALMKKVEDELKAELEDDLKDFTLSEGKILLKLIDRETGNTSYELVKELRGAVSAVFWQSLSRLFGANLKSDFDPINNKEDRRIDDIVVLIERGDI